MQIYITVPTIMHAELLRGNHNHAFLNRRHMCRPIDMTTYKQALFDILDRQAGKRSTAAGGSRAAHIDDAAP